MIEPYEAIERDLPAFCYDIVLTQGNQKTLFNKNIANTKASFVPKL